MAPVASQLHRPSNSTLSSTNGIRPDVVAQIFEHNEHMENEVAILTDVCNQLREDVNVLLSTIKSNSGDQKQSGADLTTGSSTVTRDQGRFLYDGAGSTTGFSESSYTKGSSSAKMSGALEPKPKSIPPHLRKKQVAPLPTTEPITVKHDEPEPVTNIAPRVADSFVAAHHDAEDDAPLTASSSDPAFTERTATDPDFPVQSVEESFVEHVGWQPHFIKNLGPAVVVGIPNLSETATFSWDFLQRMFGGVEWSPGLYYKPVSHGKSMLPRRTFYALHATHEPYLPMRPGEHGAKLTAFFNEPPEDLENGEDIYTNVPIFITASPYAQSGAGNIGRYIYFGHFTQTRWSDKIDCDNQRNHIPNSVKMYWAMQLADPSRPEWVTMQLMKHFFPMPQYEGSFSGLNIADGSVSGGEDEHVVNRMESDVRAYIAELKDWKREAGMMVSMLTKEAILEAFQAPDAADPPGMRLWWEYFECVGFDRGFYDMLVEQRDAQDEQKSD